MYIEILYFSGVQERSWQTVGLGGLPKLRTLCPGESPWRGVMLPSRGRCGVQQADGNQHLPETDVWRLLVYVGDRVIFIYIFDNKEKCLGNIYCTGHRTLDMTSLIILVHTFPASSISCSLSTCEGEWVSLAVHSAHVRVGQTGTSGCVQNCDWIVNGSLLISSRWISGHNDHRW